MTVQTKVEREPALSEREAELLDRGPYVGAEPFGAADKLFFHGRDREGQQLASLVASGTLTVVYGESGVGKSSLLNAKLPDELDNLDPGWSQRVITFSEWQPGFLARLVTLVEERIASIQARTGATPSPDSMESDDPMTDGVAAQAAECTAQAAPVEDGLAASLLDAIEEDETPLVLILDQFEEFFLYHPHGDDGFEQELATVANVRDGPVHLVLSLRSDGLFLLDRLRWRMPDIFRRMLEILPLDPGGARAAIIKPLLGYNELAKRAAAATVLEPDTRLISALIDGSDEAILRARLSLGGKGGIAETSEERKIVAPFLQLALTKLWRAEQPRKAAPERPVALRLETLRRLADRREDDDSDDTRLVGNIVQRYVDEILGAFSRNEQEACVAILDQMVTPTGSKVASTPSAIQHKIPEIHRPLVPELLEALEKDRANRLLRRTAGRDGDTESSFEIVIDLLAVPLLDWIGRERARQRLAHEAEQQERERKKRRRTIGWITLAIAVTGLAALTVLTLWRENEQRIADVNLMAEQAEDRSLHGTAREAILMAMEALRQHRLEPKAEREMRLHALLGRLLDGPADMGVVYSAPSRIYEFRPTADGQEIVVARTAPAQPAAKSAQPAALRSEGSIIEWVPIDGHSGSLRQYEAGDASTVVFAADGDTVAWRRNQGAFSIVSRNGGAPSTFTLPDGERLGKVLPATGGQYVITTSNREPTTPETSPSPTSARPEPPIQRWWDLATGHSVELPSAEAGSLLQMASAGPDGVVAFGPTNVATLAAPDAAWRRVYEQKAGSNATIIFAQTNENGRLLLVLTSRRDASTPIDVEMILVDLGTTPATELGRTDWGYTVDGDVAPVQPFLYLTSENGLLSLLDGRTRSWTRDVPFRRPGHTEMWAGPDALYTLQNGNRIRRWQLPPVPDLLPISPAIASALSASRQPAPAQTASADYETNVAFNNETMTLVAVDNDGRAQVLPGGGAPLDLGSVSSGLFPTVTGVAMSAGAKVVALSGGFGRVRLVSDGGRDSRLLSFDSFYSNPTAISLTVDGSHLAVALQEKLSIVTDLQRDERVTVSAPPDLRALAWSGNDQYLMAGDRYGRVSFWHVNGSTALPYGADIDVGVEITRVAMSSNGMRAATVTKRGAVEVWDTAKGNQLGHWTIDNRIVSVWMTDTGVGVLLDTGQRVTWTVHDPAQVEHEIDALNLCPLTASERQRLKLPAWSTPAATAAVREPRCQDDVPSH